MRPQPHPRHPLAARGAQRGTTLLEGLVAFLVLCLGMLTVARVQTQLHLGAELAGQRLQATRLAQQELETLRDFVVLASAPGQHSFDDIRNAAHRVAAHADSLGGVSYVVAARIDPAGAAAKSATVTVSWNDRAGSAQRVALASIIDGTDPAYSGALALAARDGPPRVRSARAAAVPRGARDLGNGTSVFKPVEGAPLALVLDNASAQVLARCAGTVAAAPTRELDPAGLSPCDARIGYLISGTVRFSLAAPPDAAAANDLPLPADVTLQSAPGSDIAAPAPSCTTQALRTVARSGPDGTQFDAVALAAEPGAALPAGATPTGERYLAYDCVVYPGATASWSGTTVLRPSGWRIGTDDDALRVCRYADVATDPLERERADARQAPRVDHVRVTRTLAHQNFLVIRARETCPAGAVAPGSDALLAASPRTLAHQP